MQEPSTQHFRPFRSKRCADVDLAKWPSGGYAFPSTDPDDVDELVGALERASDDPDLPRPS
ncbi:hypothetical protein OAN307_c31700 [Octadecabacter antarcticus 307]|uniref:Uncharacterized protein n=1 Tax=Octadecabacter antarcticus 307 TaxID=391626 RepID=M9R911_9RHOB|nr:DNA gyrase inhibitor YacG [Octadecabacter antarcticus]AGI68702.1 hypothetical protein OAN307_c31700 [Octadecabacter antarcticus 307]